MSATEPLTRKRLKELLDYNPETGVFTWKERESGSKGFRQAGKTAGRVWRGRYTSYRTIKVDQVDYLAHRLVCLYVKGYWPEETDHRNGVGIDNHLKNLSFGTKAQNLRNRALSSNSSTGVCGVSFIQDKGVYAVSVKSEGKTYWGGRFKTLGEATKKARQMYENLGFPPTHGLTRDERASS